MPRSPGPPARAFAAVWSVVSRIPPGRLATYGQVARMAGMPGAARTVGWALRALPDGTLRDGRAVPWHRVINAAGRVSVRGAAGGECRRQVARLRREGIRPGPDGAYDLGRYGWDGRAAAKRAAASGGRPAPPSARSNWSAHSRA